MKCPNCHHDTEGKQHWCHECDNVFAYTPTETWNHLDYMLAWLEEQQPILVKVQYDKMREDLLARQRQLEIDLHIPELQAIEMAAAAAVVPEPVELVAVEPEPILVEKAPPVVVAEPVAAVAQPVIAAKPVRTATPPVQPKPKKEKEPEVKRPLIDWGNAWDKVVAAAVSGALLTGLL